jgi:TATA-binding protein-associated factor Taf7
MLSTIHDIQTLKELTVTLLNTLDGLDALTAQYQNATDPYQQQQFHETLKDIRESATLARRQLRKELE